MEKIFLFFGWTAGAGFDDTIGMARPGIYTKDIFRLADELIGIGWFSGLADGQYCLLLIGEPGERYTIHRSEVNAVLPKSFRVWLVKGSVRYPLGESSVLPREAPAAVGPPFW